MHLSTAIRQKDLVLTLGTVTMSCLFMSKICVGVGIVYCICIAVIG